MKKLNDLTELIELCKEEEVSFSEVKSSIDWLGFYPVVDEDDVIIDIVDAYNVGHVLEKVYNANDDGDFINALGEVIYEFDFEKQAYR